MGNPNQRLDEDLLSRMWDYIKNYHAENGESPTQREIAEYCGTNPRRAYKYVHVLASRGCFELDDYDGTIITPSRLDPMEYQFVPKIGIVRCGKPSLAVEDYDEVFRLPKEFTGTGEFFMLEAEGGSMIDANIFEGDNLVIRRQQTANPGDIVVAVKESDYGYEEADATLKTFKYKNGKPVLHAENDSGEYEDMDAREFRIIGKLKCIIRDMEVVG